MVLVNWVDIEAAHDVRVLPARAMRAALRKTFLEADLPCPNEIRRLRADACEERLDDPQFDMFVAVVNGQPAGRCALYQVGDIARLTDLAVPAPFARRGVAAALAASVLTLARRLAVPNVCLQVDSSDAARRAWFESVGFAADGSFVEFTRGQSVRSDNTP
jgi:N-acetylglutamate synthase-like GNAT family acetyltransferase